MFALVRQDRHSTTARRQGEDHAEANHAGLADHGDDLDGLGVRRMDGVRVPVYEALLSLTHS